VGGDGSRRGPLLVPGGARGRGGGGARAAARAGWNVALTYVSSEGAAQDVVAGIEAAGARGTAIRGDVADEAALARAFDAAETLGPLRAVVANAGIVADKAPLAEMTAERLRRMVDVNVMGALFTAREVARRLADGGSLVLVSSAAARLGGPGEYVDYAATKGALDTLAIGLSKELAPRGIRVNAVRPGIVDTDIHASGGQPDRAARLAPLVPLARPGTADEIAAAILWLCSDASGYVTGAHLDVSGGR
ncbi:MAG: SDR family oxidoreductase, partial [Shimia sp.]